MPRSVAAARSLAFAVAMGAACSILTSPEEYARREGADRCGLVYAPEDDCGACVEELCCEQARACRDAAECREGAQTYADCSFEDDAAGCREALSGTGLAPSGPGAWTDLMRCGGGPCSERCAPCGGLSFALGAPATNAPRPPPPCATPCGRAATATAA